MAVALCTQATGATRYVSKDGSNEPPYQARETAATGIPPAIEIAEPGDTVLVSAGLYYAPWTGPLWVPGGVTLRGEGAYLTIIDFEATLEDDVLYETLVADDGAVVEDIWIEGSRGASILAWAESATFRRCTLARVELEGRCEASFEDCLFYGGEMLECRDYSAPHFRGCTFLAYDEGGVLCRGGTKPVDSLDRSRCYIVESGAETKITFFGYVPLARNELVRFGLWWTWDETDDFWWFYCGFAWPYPELTTLDRLPFLAYGAHGMDELPLRRAAEYPDQIRVWPPGNNDWETLWLHSDGHWRKTLTERADLRQIIVEPGYAYQFVTSRRCLWTDDEGRRPLDDKYIVATRPYGGQSQ